MVQNSFYSLNGLADVGQAGLFIKYTQLLLADLYSTPPPVLYVSEVDSYYVLYWKVPYFQTASLHYLCLDTSNPLKPFAPLGWDSGNIKMPMDTITKGRSYQFLARISLYTHLLIRRVLKEWDSGKIKIFMAESNGFRWPEKCEVGYNGNINDGSWPYAVTEHLEKVGTESQEVVQKQGGEWTTFVQIRKKGSFCTSWRMGQRAHFYPCCLNLYSEQPFMTDLYKSHTS